MKMLLGIMSSLLTTTIFAAEIQSVRICTDKYVDQNGTFKLLERAICLVSSDNIINDSLVGIGVKNKISDEENDSKLSTFSSATITYSENGVAILSLNGFKIGTALNLSTEFKILAKDNPEICIAPASPGFAKFRQNTSCYVFKAYKFTSSLNQEIDQTLFLFDPNDIVMH